MRVPKHAVSLQQPAEYIKMTLPRKLGDAPLFLCPGEFSQMMELRVAKFAEIQTKIKNAKLTHD